MVDWQPLVGVVPPLRADQSPRVLQRQLRVLVMLLMLDEEQGFVVFPGVEQRSERRYGYDRKDLALGAAKGRATEIALAVTPVHVETYTPEI